MKHKDAAHTGRHLIEINAAVVVENALCAASIENFHVAGFEKFISPVPDAAQA